MEIFRSNVNPKAPILIDGTHIYIQKSKIFFCSKRCFTACLSLKDGYIIDIHGPFAATTSDAQIIEAILAVDLN